MERFHPDTDSKRGWFVVLAAFIAAFVIFGVTYSFGIFLKPISESVKASNASVSTVFATSTILSFFLAPLTGRAADRLGARFVVTMGACLLFVGLIGTARAVNFASVFWTYGVLIGVAASCIYVPSIAAVGSWFGSRRELALGISISGIGCGTLTAGPLASKLIDSQGWRITFEYFGWASLLLLLISATLLLQPPFARRSKSESVLHEVCTRQFVSVYAGLFFMGVAVYVAIVFLPAFASHVGVDRVGAGAIIGYVGAAGVVGRLGLSAVATKVGLRKVFKSAFVLLFFACVLWMFATSYPMLVMFGLLLGMAQGGIAAMAPAAIAAIFGVERLGELFGFLFTSFGFASLVGPPMAGLLLDHTHDYRWPICLTIVSAICGTVVMWPLNLAPLGDNARGGQETSATRDG